MKTKQEVEEILATKQAERIKQSKIDDLDILIAKYNKHISRAKSSGEIELMNALQAKLEEIAAEQQNIMSKIR